MLGKTVLGVLLLVGELAALAATTETIASEAYPANPNLMPNIGNGFVGMAIDSDDVYMAGLYCYHANFLIFSGTQRCRISVPEALNMTISGSKLQQVELNMRNGMVTKLLQLQGAANATVVQKLYAHREFTSLMVNQFEVDNSKSKVDLEIHFQVDKASAKTVDIDLKQVSTKYANIVAEEGKVHHAEEGEGAITVAVAQNQLAGQNVVRAGKVQKFFYVASFRSSRDVLEGANEDPAQNAVDDIAKAQKLVEKEELESRHVAAWAELWEGGIETDNIELAQVFNSSLYYLLSSVDSKQNWPTGPGGVQTNGYWGNAAWDNEVWQMPAILAMWPDLALTGIQYRYERRSEAAAYATEHKLKGLYFPYQTASTGKSVDLVEFANKLEKHTGGDLAYLLRVYWDITHDEAMKDKIRALAGGICDFYISAATKSSTTGLWSINNVVPADEYAFGMFYQGVDNSIFTNVGAAQSCALAARLSKETESLINGDTVALWEDFAANITIEVAEYGKSGETYHPEYSGWPGKNFWNRGVVKQADVVMAGFPLGLKMTREQRINDMNAYEPLYDPAGPGMTFPMHTIGHLEVGNASAAADYFNLTLRNIQEPFKVWTETADSNQAASFTDMGCYNFITGAGGFLQSVIYGYFGLRIREDGIYLKPQILENAKYQKLRGLKFRGSRMDVELNGVSGQAQISLTKQGPGVIRGNSSILTAQNPITFTGELLLTYSESQDLEFIE